MMVPTVLAMVICDAVWRDPETGKATVLGTLTSVVACDVPLELGQLCVYFEMSGHQGTVTVRGDLIDAADGITSPPASAESTIAFADRLTVVGGAVPFYNVDLPAFGEDYVELSAADTPLADRRFVVGPPA